MVQLESDGLHALVVTTSKNKIRDNRWGNDDEWLKLNKEINICTLWSSLFWLCYYLNDTRINFNSNIDLVQEIKLQGGETKKCIQSFFFGILGLSEYLLHSYHKNEWIIWKKSFRSTRTKKVITRFFEFSSFQRSRFSSSHLNHPEKANIELTRRVCQIQKHTPPQANTRDLKNKS